MKIKIVQYMWGDKNRSYKVIRQINENYCRRHGYEYVCAAHPPQEGRSPTWEKITAMTDALHDCEYLLYLDADAFFFGQEFTVEGILLHMIGNKLFMMASDCGSTSTNWNPDLPNAGVILVKNHPRTLEILKTWDELSAKPEFKRLCWGRYHEQEALWRTFWKTNREDFVLVREYYLMNGFRGLYIRHQMGTDDETRLELLKRYLRGDNAPKDIVIE